MAEAKVPDDESVRASIVETYNQITRHSETTQKLHYVFQRSVAHLSSRFALGAQIEYVLPRFRGDRDGRLDVVWKYGTIPVVAFEIDSVFRAKSLRKLLAINANLRYWMYIGDRNVEAFVSGIDPIGIIRVIELRSGSDSQGSHTEPILSKVVTPVDVAKCQEDANHATGFEEIRKRYPKAYERWIPEEDRLLEIQFKSGEGIMALALRFQRKPSAIRSRLEKLDLL
jgi:hypothetical protein